VTRRKRRPRRQGPRVDPYVSYLILAGIGVGTWQVGQPLRHTLLWLSLLVASLLYVEARPLKANYSLQNVGRGAAVGALFSVPLLIFAWRYLGGFAILSFHPLENPESIAISPTGVHLLFYQLCLLAAPVEELYFRGFVQRERGMGISVLLYACTALIYFVPGAHVQLVGVIIFVIGYALLGFVYSYAYARHGLSAAIASHVVVNLLVFVLPAIGSSVP